MNDNNPKVSIVVPLYNQKHFLEKCIRTITGQTYRNIEIIIVNDGSTDKSPLIAEKWSVEDHRIKVVNKQNEGLSLARRDGYLAATGEFLTFVDSDDLIPLDAIEVMVKYMLEKNVDLVVGSASKKLGFIKKRMNDNIYSFPFYEVVEQPELFDNYYLGFFSNRIFRISAWGRLFRKSVIDKAFQETELFSSKIRFMGEDHFLNMMLFPYLQSMYRIREDVYTYRYGGGTTKYNPGFSQILFFSDLRLKYLDNYNYSAGYEPLFDEYISCFYYQAEQLLEFKQTDRDGVIEYFKEELQKREIVPRLIDFYKEKESISQRVQLIIDHDYEGMYNFANSSMKKRCATFKYIATHSINNMINYYHKFF